MPTGEHKASNGHSQIVQFFVNIQILAKHNREQVVILFGMLFTFIIWVISAFSLLVAVLFYLTFLWHHVPNEDRGLSNYCRRKIDSRLHKIVGVKVNKALAKVNTDRTGREVKAIKNRKIPAQIARQPTLPILDTKLHDKVQDRSSLSRQTTQTTLPPYVSRQSSRTSDHPSKFPYGETMIPNMFPLPRPPLPPSRSTTQSSAFSNASCASNTPLMGEAAEMGYFHPSPTYTADLLSRIGTDHKVKTPVERSVTASLHVTQRSYYSVREPPRMPDRITSDPVHMEPPRPQNTGIGRFEPFETGARSPILHHAFNLNEQTSSIDDHRRCIFRSQGNRGTPAQEFELRPQRPAELPANFEYAAFDPSLHGSQPGTLQPSLSTRPAPSRNFTMPIKPYESLRSTHQHQQFTPPQRSGTAPTSRTLTYSGFPPASYAWTDDDALPK